MERWFGVLVLSGAGRQIVGVLAVVLCSHFF